MIIFLYGPDTYSSRQKLNEIIEQYKKIHKSGLNLKYLDLKEKSFEDFKEIFGSVAMFYEKKLIILENAISNKSFKEKFSKEIKKFAKSKELILFHEKNKIPEDNFSRLLKTHGKSQEFKLLEGYLLRNWVEKEFKKYEVKIEPAAVKELINFIGSDLWRMENEIKKLTNYKTGNEIKKEDVRLLVRPKLETDIFKTIDAIASKDKKKALKLIHQHLEKGDHPVYLLSMINFQFRNLLIIKDLLIKNRSPFVFTDLHPFVIKKSCALSKKFELSKLKDIYRKIFQIDLDIKSGRLKPETALDLLIAEI